MKEMVLKNYNLIAKLIVPLLDENIKLEDLSKESGFVNAYTEDINKPFYYNHIFLLYESVDTKESLERFQKFNKLKTIHNRRYVTINNKHYIVYTFIKINKDINNILKCGQVFNPKNSLIINKFWKDLDSEMFQKCFHPRYELSEEIKDILPEEDYYPYEPQLVI